MKMTVFWNIAPCSLVEIDWSFTGVYCLLHSGRGSKHLWNVGQLPEYTAQYSRRPSTILHSIYERRISRSGQNLWSDSWIWIMTIPFSAQYFL
jgi:hypothetical protein